MAKQLNVSLAFTADTSKAKKEIQDLQTQLTQLINSVGTNKQLTGLNSEIQKSVSAAAKLKVQLESATNVDTGKLDLGKFNDALNKGGINLKQYQSLLSNLGSAGDQAFASLTRSIMNAEVPLKRSSTLLTEFATTLKNTARWQISSSILHGFMGSISSAYRYAQDLNQSLNNIRIVTSYNTDQMAKFADQANKAAQALSTTTTNYTDAALIYYQQGIRDQEEIAGRTETTIKLANISRQSAEEVSSQMTAIWNNFDNGSHSLEYYADVITALGANTASSSQEIAKGMQQFAAVADTVGLSYEYAAASLATIVATTRQSESTVGNGLRTIFSRLEGLKLGDTLEDGTDLNKYSAALATIGVNIKDTTGNLKDMDIILEETASKWDTLDKAQKVAFATTVGGVRQYTNLIALLDNWDMVQENIGIAKNSEGTLQEQADIYAESWEAAQKRVKAAAQAIYSDLLNDNFFITILNGFEKILQEVDIFIDSMGGLKGAISIVGTALLSVFNKDIATNIDNMIYSISMMTSAGRAKVEGRRQEAINALITSSANGATDAEVAASDVYKKQAQSQQLLLDNNERLSDQERQQVQLLLDQQEILGQQVIKSAELVEKTRNRSEQLTDETRNYANKGDSNFNEQEYNKQTERLKQATEAYIKQKSAKQDLLKISKSEIKDVSKLEEAYNKYDKILNDNGIYTDRLAKAKAQGAEAYKQELQNIAQTVTSTKEYTDAEKALAQTIEEGGTAPRDAAAAAKDLKNAYIEETQAAEEQRRANENLKGSYQSIAETIQNAKGHFLSTGEAISLGAQQIMALSMSINALKGLGNIWSNEDLSIGEKILQTITTLAITIPMLTTAFNAEKIAQMEAFAATSLLGGAKIAEAATNGTLTMTEGLLSVAKKLGVDLNQAYEEKELQIIVAKKLENQTNLQLIASQTLLNAQFWLAIAAIAAVVAITYSLVKAYNKSADDAKKASEASKKLTEQYQKTKDSYEELKKSIEDHDNAVKAIDKLKKGTEEWRDAIQDSNEKVLELINNYPKLAAAVNRNQDGILTIDKNSSFYQEYLKQEEDSLNAVFEGQVAGQILSRNANYENDLVQASRKISYKDGTYTDEYGQSYDLSKQISPEQLKKVVELYNQDNSLFNENNKDELAKTLNITNENLCEALILNQEKISELSAELSANTDSNKLAAEQIGMKEFAKNNSSFTEQEIQAVSTMLGNNFISELSDQQKYWSQDYLKSSVQNQYASAMGYTIDKRKNDGTVDYKDSQNNIINISNDVAVDLVATQQALKNIGENADKAKIAIENLQIGAKNLGNEIGDKDSAFGVLTGTSGGKDFNFSNLTEEQFEGIKKAWKAAAGRDGKSGVTEEEFFKYFGISDEYARSKGYKSGLAMAQAFANGINNYANDVKYKNILDSLMPTAKPFEEASANYNTITSAGNKITDDNYILDDKSYQELEAAGIAVDQYFEQMADGTHLLTSSVSDFKSVVDSVANSELYTAQANQEKITGSLEAYSASGGISSLITDQDKNNILQFSGVSPEDIANIQMIEDSMARMDAYAEKFKELGLTGDVEKINELLQQSADETQKIQDAIENSQFKDKVADAGLDLENTIQYSKHLQNLAKNEETAYLGADKLSKELANNDDAAKNLSVQVQKMNKGVESLSKNWKNWSDMLKNSSKGSTEYFEALQDTRSALSDLLDISEEFLNDDFVDSLANDADSMKLMEDAAKGDGDAIDSLRQKTLDNIILNLELNDSELSNEEVLNRVHDLQSMLDAMGPIAVGATIDTSGMDAGEADFIAALNKLIEDAGMGKTAVNAMLSGMGYTANFASEPQDVIVKHPDLYDTKRTLKDLSYTDDPVNGRILTGYTIHDEQVLVKKGETEHVQMDAASLETSEPGTTVVPKINSLTKNASGSANNSSSSNKGGSGGGHGGGGGGGGGKEAKPAKKKTLTKKDGEKEVDRYIKINQELAQKEHESNLLQTKLDSTSGQTAIKVMKEQLGILQQQRKLYGELAKEAENYRVKDLEKLKKDFSELSFEIDPSDGMLINYETLLKEQTDIYNKVYKEWADKLEEAEKAYIAEWERLGEEAATEEAMKPFQDKIDKIKEDMAQPLQDAQEKYDLFKKDTDKYNEAVETARKGKEDEAAAILEEYNKELDIIAKGVELKIKVDDADLQYLEFLLKQIGEGADKALDRMSNYTKSIDDNMSKIDKYQEGLYEVLDHAGIDMEDLLDGDIDDLGSFNENDLAKIEEYRDGLIECGEQLIELRKTLLNEVSEAFDEFNSDLDRAVSKIEHLKTFTETYKNLIDIVGKRVLDPMGKTTLMLARTTYTQAESNTKALKSQLDYQLSAIEDYNRVIADLEADNANGEHDDTIKEFKNQLKEAEDAYASTQESWLSSWEETVQAAADIYEAELNQILEDFSNSISGMMRSLDELSEEYNRIQTIQDIYVDDYEKIYQLSKLNRDINNSLDDSTTLASKRKLRDIQKEINELQESGVEVSQYDLDVLRKKYEMALAYEQWQDAQNAKTVVRMQRDNEGNYGYVYTADESDVEAAEQNYEDKLHEMQVLNAEYIQSLQEQIIQAQQDCADALANLRAQDFASYEEYQEAVETIRRDYTKRIQTLSQQMNNAMDNNRTLYEQDWTAYHEATGYKISADEDYIDRFNETVYSQLTGFETMEDAQDAFVSAVNDAADLAAQNWEDWYIRTNSALDLGGNSIQNYSQEVDEAVNGSGGLVEQTWDAEEAVHEMADEYDEAFTEIIDYAWDFANNFDSVIQEIIEGCNNAIEAIMRLLEAMAEAEGEDFDADEEEPDDYQWVNLKEGTGEYEWAYQSASTGKRKTGDFEADYTLEDGRKYRASYTSNESGILQASEENSEHNGYYGAKNVRELTDSIKELDRTMNQMVDDTPGIVSGASGMYTGDWGSSGKLAILHEKELVLNKEDTSNILSAVDMIRSISNTIDLNALAAGAAFTGRSSATLSTFGNKESLEQNVHITAEFPSVSDHNEIEQALNSLVERAAQFAGRKKF